MKNKNIVKLDRTTVQEYLPMLTHRGTFSKFNNLPQRDELLKEEMERLNVKKLSLEQERKLLSTVGKYRSKQYVHRDYGDYVISFSARFYLDNLTRTEEELKDEVLKEQYDEKQIQSALKKINTYKLAHKLAIVILGEVYKQRTHEDVLITKQQLVQQLGYDTSEKYIYADIKEAIYSLRLLDYKIFRYNTKIKFRKDSKSIGNFIYNLTESTTEYRLDVNPQFVGCVLHMVSDGSKLTKEERAELFSRGYLEYPLTHIIDARRKSDAAYYLGHYFLTQKGNPKLNTKKFKVITVAYDKLIRESHIEHSRSNVRVNKLLDTFEELPQVQQIEPSIKELRKMKSKFVEKQTIRIYINRQLKSDPKGAKKV